MTSGRDGARNRLAALEAGVDVVVVVGGDGTLREVLAALPSPDLPVGLVPVGTANVMRLELGLPREVGPALDVVLAGHVARVDAARVDGALSVLVVGVGFDARVVRELERRRRGPITRWHYVPAIARALRGYRPPRLEVEVDGERLAEPYGLVLIGNVVRYAGCLTLGPERRLDDGLFEVYLFRDAGVGALAGAAARGLVRRLPGRVCEVRRARRVRVESDGPVPYHVDGDDGGDTPLVLEVEPRPYALLAPPARVGGRAR